MRTRKLQLLLTAYCFVGLLGMSDEVRTNYGGFHVVLGSERSVYGYGKPVVVTVTLTNDTRDTVLWELPFEGDSCVFGYFKVDSLSFGSNLPCRLGKHFSLSGLEEIRQNPGDVSSIKADLSARFGMKTPGVYSVQFLGRWPVPISISNEPVVPLPPLIITITNRVEIEPNERR